MKKCKHCQTEIDKKASICPACRKRVKTSRLTWLILVIFVGVVYIALNSDEYNLDSGEIKLLDGHIGYVDDYGIAYYIEGTVENETNKDYTYVQITFSVYDSEGANLGTCLSNNNNLKAGEKWKFKAICTGEANSVARYEFDEITSW